MSRLESMMRRLAAQKDGLEWAAAEIRDMSGDVLELGLGNGRTYDHLRQILPDRRIWIIDRGMNCHPSCVPPVSDFLQGEASEMLGKMVQLGVQVSFAHYDFGFGDKARDVAEAMRLSMAIAGVMISGGVIASSQPLMGFDVVRGPLSVAPERYCFYRVP